MRKILRKLMLLGIVSSLTAGVALRLRPGDQSEDRIPGKDGKSRDEKREK